MSDSYEVRVVEFERIHQVTSRQMAQLLRVVRPQPGQEIMDVCSGYGAVTRALLEQSISSQPPLTLWALDSCAVQLARFHALLPGVPAERVVLGDMRSVPIERSGFLDCAVIKMGIHEVPKDEQSKVFAEMFRLLKPAGKLVLWQMLVEGEHDRFATKVVRYKDQLAGFSSLLANRYFPTLPELFKLYHQFRNVAVMGTTHYQFSPQLRRDELISGETQMLLREDRDLTSQDPVGLEDLAQKRMAELSGYIRTLEQSGEGVARDFAWSSASFTIPNVIMIGYKP